MAIYSYYTIETRGLPSRNYGGYSAKEAATCFLFELKRNAFKLVDIPTQLVVTSQAGNKWHVSLDVQLREDGRVTSAKIVDFARITK